MTTDSGAAPWLRVMRRCRRRAVAVVGATLSGLVVLGACGGGTGSRASGGGTGTLASTAPPSTSAAPTLTTAPTATTAPTTIAGGTEHAAQPRGLIAVQQYQPGDLPVFPAAVFDDSFIAGVELRAYWQDVEPEPNQFNWQFIDQVFAQADVRNKFVVLTVVPGFGTPTWALQSPVVSAPFPRQYGQGQGEVGSLPVPWDQTYLSRWFTFLQEVASRYGSNPAFRMISAAGPTSVSSEMSLPNRPADIAAWMKLGYTPTLYQGAWNTVFQAYERIFPRQYFSLSLYPGLRIGERMKPDAAQSTATPQAILGEGLDDKSSFVLQTSGLTGAKNGADLYNLVASNSGIIVTGFQLQTSATNFPGEMGDAGSAVSALTLTLQEGLAAHVSFLEVYEPDVVNPAMATVLEQTAAQLQH